MNRVIQGKHGLMIYDEHDTLIGRCLEVYGEWSELEVEIFERYVYPGHVVLDVGANIGTHTVVFSRLVGSGGTVFSFEPERHNFYMLCGNVAINSLRNVYCLQRAVGEEDGTILMAETDREQEQNFGEIKVGAAAGYPVQMSCLDTLQLPRCDFIKIDVEGMELAVLRGATETITKYRPVIYLEDNRDDLSRTEGLRSLLQSWGYMVIPHEPLVFNKGNFARCPENYCGTLRSHNLVCIP